MTDPTPDLADLYADGDDYYAHLAATRICPWCGNTAPAQAWRENECPFCQESLR